ncbi:sugar-binding transcriptional regulator [Pelagibius sp.]|uniref:sugar-binding transcriptional regulator n=1 Tax=Pelagibius sp. TaxID=1931238 RepID=UPI00260D31A5|nr:sugar-binding transcriptional regulator [Pelagibius sp.]
MNRRTGNDASITDEAARAGWLYYIAGKTQDEIARMLGVSRQRAQRLVSRAISENLIHVRLEHPIAKCMDLESRLAERHGLLCCRVAPSVGESAHTRMSIASIAAYEIEQVLRQAEPRVIALGSGRMLRAAIEELADMECEQHKIVSLVGNIAPDGSASFYDVIMRIADAVRAPHYPMPLPVLAETPQEREIFYSLKPVQNVEKLAKRADVAFVGVGQLSDDAPLLQDGFITKQELKALRAEGAVGEIVGWVYDSAGNYLSGGMNARVSSVRVSGKGERRVTGIAAGIEKIAAIEGALKGRLINGLVTDEETAEELLAAP